MIRDETMPTKKVSNRLTGYKEEKEYLIFVDHRFSRMAEKELVAALPNCKLEPYKINNNSNPNVVFFKLESKDILDDVPAKINAAASSFVDFVVPVDAVINTEHLLEYSGIEEVISDIIDAHKYASFKIEVKKIDFVSDETAKSIEVRLGSDLEKCGYRADLKTPEVIVYPILLNASVIIGHIDTSSKKRQTLDLFRQANRENENQVNRAEYKIKEAIEFFGIDLRTHKRALDIGAAPGGWTHYMSQRGIKVVAVDGGFLDYKKISSGKDVLILADEERVPQIQKMIEDEGLSANVSVMGLNDHSIEMNRYDVIHIKTNTGREGGVELLRRFGKFDILTIDTNTLPSESAAIANSLVGLLDANTALIMTTKLTTKAFSRHISIAETELSKNYASIRFKKLPHNRQEITVYGVLNSVA
ncbi:ribosomal RNA methyltransferase RrmJ/FtsJ [mine drainage metagenome]|uniref:Ribosomal RNA methyltransferase RrmJ/FtsJ n=1 Tax=mine drainage metagenome TaxID=410659 RepID=T1BAH9_9ZZZZ